MNGGIAENYPHLSFDSFPNDAIPKVIRNRTMIVFDRGIEYENVLHSKTLMMPPIRWQLDMKYFPFEKLPRKQAHSFSLKSQNCVHHKRINFMEFERVQKPPEKIHQPKRTLPTKLGSLLH